MIAVAQAILAPVTLTDRRNEITTVKARATVSELAPRDVMTRKPMVFEFAIASGTDIRLIRLSLFSSLEQAWLKPTVVRASRLLALQPNWDREGAPQIKPTALQNAINVLSSFMRSESALPQWTPTRDGGVQLDWHERGIHLEISFLPEGPGGDVACHDERGEIPDFDGTIDETMDQLRQLFTERLIG